MWKSQTPPKSTDPAEWVSANHSEITDSMCKKNVKGVYYFHEEKQEAATLHVFHPQLSKKTRGKAELLVVVFFQQSSVIYAYDIQVTACWCAQWSHLYSNVIFSGSRTSLMLIQLSYLQTCQNAAYSINILSMWIFFLTSAVLFLIERRRPKNQYNLAIVSDGWLSFSLAKAVRGKKEALLSIE